MKKSKIRAKKIYPFINSKNMEVEYGYGERDFKTNIY